MMFSLMLFIVLLEVGTTLAKPNCTHNGYQTFKVNSGPDLSNASNCMLTYDEGTQCILEFCAYDYEFPKLHMMLNGRDRRYSGKDSLCFTINYTIPANEFVIKIGIDDICNRSYSNLCKGFGIPSNKTNRVSSSIATTIVKTRTPRVTSRKYWNTTADAHKSIPSVLEVYWYLLLSIPVFLMITISGTFVIVNMSRKRCFKMDQDMTSVEHSKATTKSNQTSAKQSQSSLSKKSKATSWTVSDGGMGPNKYPNSKFESEVDVRGYRKDEDGRSLWSASVS